MEKQQEIFRPKTGIPVLRRILSVLIRFLSTGTGFSNHQSGSYRQETRLFKSHSGFLSTGTGIPAEYWNSGS